MTNPICAYCHYPIAEINGVTRCLNQKCPEKIKKPRRVVHVTYTCGIHDHKTLQLAQECLNERRKR